MASQRQMPRFRQQLGVMLNVFDNLWHQATTLDFGPSGLCLSCSDVPVVTDQLQLKVLLPDGRVIHMLATPVWMAEESQKLGTRDKRKVGLRINSAPEAWYQYCHQYYERLRAIITAPEQASLP